MNKFGHIARRRRAIRSQFDVAKEFELLEESCVPSYCHRNRLAAYAAWWRLFVAARMMTGGPVLDFGAGSGELAHLIAYEYHFVEANERFSPPGTRQNLDDLPERHFATVAALDSLEHNDDSRAIVQNLVRSVRPGGRFVLSGPTENML